METPLAQITDQVRRRVRLEGVDLSAEPALAARYARDEVRRYSERALGGSDPLLADEGLIARQVVAALTGLGAIQPYLDDPTVEELWINAPDRVLASATPRVAESARIARSDRASTASKPHG